MSIQQGIKVLKASKSGTPRSKILQINQQTNELKWHSPNQQAFSNLDPSTINKVLRLQRRFGFQIETSTKTLVFITETQEDMENCITQLQKFTIPTHSLPTSLSSEDENLELPSPEKKRHNTLPSIVLSEVNTPLLCSRELFSKGKPKVNILNTLMDILNEYFESNPHENPHHRVNSFEEIPTKLSEMLSREPSDNNYQEKLNFLQAKLSAMESDREKYDLQQQEIEKMKDELTNLQSRSEHMVKTLEAMHQEKAKVARECRLYKTELDFTVEKLHKLESALQDVQESPIQIGQRKYEPLCVGAEVQLNVEGEIIKQLMTTTPDYKKVVIRECDMGTSKQEIRLFEILEMQLEGNQLKLRTAQQTQYAISSDTNFLSLLLELWQNSRHVHSQSLDAQLTEKYRDMCNLIEGQIKLEERLIRRYKNSLTANICNLSNGMTAKQSVYSAEIDALREINENVIPYKLSQEAQTYLTAERIEMLDKLKQMNQLVALYNKESTDADEEMRRLQQKFGHLC